VKIEVGTANFQEALALVKEWRKRAVAVRKQFLYRATNKAYNDLLNALPASRRELRRSLRVQGIRGLPDNVDGYVICATPRGRTIAKAEEENTVIYVAVKAHLMEAAPEETIILQEFGPWTLDTIPYAPDERTANVISRRVSPREVIRVRKLRRGDRPELRKRMRKAGVRGVGAGFTAKPREVAAIPDAAFESLRLEFGLGGEPAKPHWGKAILKLALRGGTGMIARKREFTRAMTDLNYQAWKMWPKPVSGYTTIAQAKQYVPFQKRLGFRIKK